MHAGDTEAPTWQWLCLCFHLLIPLFSQLIFRDSEVRQHCLSVSLSSLTIIPFSGQPVAKTVKGHRGKMLYLGIQNEQTLKELHHMIVRYLNDVKRETLTPDTRRIDISFLIELQNRSQPSPSDNPKPKHLCG
jgi:hypothetical protein